MFVELIVYLITFLGILMGVFLANKTKEELSSGKKYFFLIKLVILLILVVFLILKFEFSLLSFILLILGFFAYYFYRNNCLFFGILLGSFMNIISSSLIFVYLLAEAKLKFEKKSLWFLVGIILLFFNLEKYLAFSLGSLIGIIFSAKNKI